MMFLPLQKVPKNTTSARPPVSLFRIRKRRSERNPVSSRPHWKATLSSFMHSYLMIPPMQRRSLCRRSAAILPKKPVLEILVKIPNPARTSAQRATAAVDRLVENLSSLLQRRSRQSLQWKRAVQQGSRRVQNLQKRPWKQQETQKQNPRKNRKPPLV